jgi:glycosyltransferase involved in cell wall biosynthesis
MNLLHLSNSDITGGAAQASYQIHTLLRDAGHKSVMAVRRKDSSDIDVVPVGSRSWFNCRLAEGTERLQARLSGGYRTTPLPLHYFNRNLAPIPDFDAALKAMPNPDVLFMHWITNMMTVADIRRLAKRVTCPIVWVLLDMEPMTGGCHYSGTCTRFKTECRDCPQLQTGGGPDWAGRTWHEKWKLLTDLPITFLAPTQWIGNRLSESKLLGGHPVTHIPLPMNSRLRPLEKSIAREILGAPPDKKIILVGSHDLKDPRKGMDRLVTAAKLLRKQDASDEKVLFWMMGVDGHQLANALPFPSHNAGYVSHEIELSLMYQAADVFACPSLEDAGPMMVSQAMLCGTPVVAFDTGIAPELIIPDDNGYIARLGDAEDFARGLERMLTHDGSAGKHAAEAASRHHDPRHIATLYNDLLTSLSRRP